MTNRIHIQIAADNVYIPAATALKKWAKKVLQTEEAKGDLTIRIVDESEMSELNETYRQKKGHTNVLSFAAELPPGLPARFVTLGDIVICATVIEKEAKEQEKTLDAHWAHMVIHGCYHLLGYDHIDPKDADIMEALEVKMLAQFNFPNPYDSHHLV